MGGVIYPINDKEYTAEDVEIFNCTRTSGVYSVLDFDYSLSGNVLTVGKGLAWIKNGDFSGKAIAFKDITTITLDSADDTLDRYDVIAVRYDATKTEPEIVVIKGTANESPVMPTRSTESYLYDLFLCSILRKAGESTVSLDNVTDLRQNKRYCGIMEDSVTSAVAPVYETIVENTELQAGDTVDFDYEEYAYLIATVSMTTADCDIVLARTDSMFADLRSFSGINSVSNGNSTIWFRAQINLNYNSLTGHEISIAEWRDSPNFGESDNNAKIIKIVGVTKQPKGYVAVDDVYNPESHNAQSGQAMSGALSGVLNASKDYTRIYVEDNLGVADVTYNPTSDNAQSGKAVAEALVSKQDVLNSGVNIKTINGESILGSGDIDVGGATEKVYTPNDFRNDYRSIGTGWDVSGVAISNTDLLKIRSGNKISITVPAGFRVDIRVISSEDFAEPSAISLTEDAKSNITESLNHTFINSGYLDIMVRKPVSGGFTSISPSDYACDIKVETKGIVDRMDDAEKRLGEVDNLLEEIGGNVEKNKTSIDTLTKQVLEVIPEKTYTSADFIQGWRQLGIGFENVTTYITNAELLKVEAGDKITINPNGYKVWVSVADTDDYSVSGKTYSLNKPNVTEYFEHTFEKNGYLNINVNNFGQRISPSDYTCDITVVLDDTKHRLIEIEKNSKSAEILSPKSRPFTTIVDNCQDESKWTITNKSVSAVDADCIMWDQSLHCDGRMRCTQTTYDLLNNDLVIKIRINSIAYGEEYKGNGIYMRLSNTSTPSIGAKYCLMQGAKTTPLGDWREITIPYTGYINKDKPELDFSAINDIDIFADQGSTGTSYDGTADWNIQYIGVRPRKLNKGIVSFTFDDGYKSQYTGVKLLAEKGISSTIYHIAEATGKSDDMLSTEELQKLVNYYGADIEVHGDIPENELGENGYNALSDEELIKHWTDSQKFLKENGLSSGRHMSYPGNYHSNRVVQLAKRFFDSCRTIQYYTPCESYPPADHYRLRAVSSVSAALNDVDTVKRYIDRAMESGSWLILTFHRIGDVQGDSMYCSESDLQAIADYAIESGAIIKNIAEVYDTTSISCNFDDRIVSNEGFEASENEISNAFVPSMALFYDMLSNLDERIRDIEENL